MILNRPSAPAQLSIKSLYEETTIAILLTKDPAVAKKLAN